MTLTVRHAARAVLLTREKEVLLMRMDFPWLSEELWILPGGGLEAGENAEQAVTREIFEETGALDLPIAGQLWHRDFVVDATATRMLQRYFLVHTERFEPRATALLGDEADWLREYRWWPLADLTQHDGDLNVEPQNLAAGIRRYINEGVPPVPFNIDTLLE